MDSGTMVEFETPKKLLEVRLKKGEGNFLTDFQDENSAFWGMATESKDAKNLFESVGLDYKKNV